MSTNYSGNLVDLRQRRSRIISKRIELRKQLNDNIPNNEKSVILKRIRNLGIDIDRIEGEIQKTQKGMQNSNKWMDGNFKNAEL